MSRIINGPVVSLGQLSDWLASGIAPPPVVVCAVGEEEPIRAAVGEGNEVEVLPSPAVPPGSAYVLRPARPQLPRRGG